MGYYTRFELKIVENLECVDEDFIAFKLEKFSGYSWEGGFSLDEVKWYNHKNDMRKLSKEFPSIIFMLHGEGEDSGDEWVAYYKNGKSTTHYRPEWTPPAFNESELVEC